MKRAAQARNSARRAGPTTLAAAVIRRAGLKTLPVDLLQVCSLWRDLSVAEDQLDRAGYLLRLGQWGGEIVVRKDDPPTRKRFTIAHELGHWVLDEQKLKRWMRRPRVERWCDEFARELLMPTRWMRRELKAGNISKLWQNIVAGPRRFGVSPDAFRLRVCEIADVEIIEAEIESGRLRSKRLIGRRIHKLALRPVVNAVQEHRECFPFRYRFGLSPEYHFLGDLVGASRRREVLVVIAPVTIFERNEDESAPKTTTTTL